MASKKELDLAPAVEAGLDDAFVHSGRTEPDFGPSDSSDSPSDMPDAGSGADTDRQGTGDRPDVENSGSSLDADDVLPDKIVPQEQAGLAHTAPDPERNGGEN